ncbi:MAG: hypothetical protein Q9162_002480 [Coniocarpon cinnabarinum]
MDANNRWYGLTNPPAGSLPASSPRVLIVGAGSRGNAYARAITNSTDGVVAAVAEPIANKRRALGKKYIWQNATPQPHQQFKDWHDFVAYEENRRRRLQAGVADAEPAIDAACICTLDTQHVDVILALVPLGLHILSEKPLATTLKDCVAIHRALASSASPRTQAKLFGIGHVLRYSPHNMLLRKLLLQDKIIGDVLSIEHTEPVGWWHFSHSYVRGNWRREDTTAPSLLTKSCHDIDFILWLLCGPADAHSTEAPHLPTTVISNGHRAFFKRSRKPAAAGGATNCMRCPIERKCNYSAKKIYIERHLQQGHTGWPVDIVEPEIEELFQEQGRHAADRVLHQRLAEDYDRRKASPEYIQSRNWFGRCVWESDNDVCDDQTVTIVWEDDDEFHPPTSTTYHAAKTATFHQIAHTEAQCARRGRVYGSLGEVTYDSRTIRVYDFASGAAEEFSPTQTDFNDPIASHGGGDTGLAQQFIGAVCAVEHEGMPVDRAQKQYLGCTPEDVLRSHAMVFAAEEARKSKTVVDWRRWWQQNVEEAPIAPRDWQMVDTSDARG